MATLDLLEEANKVPSEGKVVYKMKSNKNQQLFMGISARLVLLLPARASEQGNVIGSVRIYIYIYVCTKKNCN